MAGKLELQKPIMIDDVEVKEIPYDFENMTTGNKLMVTREMAAFGYGVNVEELDPVYHLFLFAKAAEIASNGKIATADILRLWAKDGQAAGTLARDFFYL